MPAYRYDSVNEILVIAVHRGGGLTIYIPQEMFTLRERGSPNRTHTKKSGQTTLELSQGAIHCSTKRVRWYRPISVQTLDAGRITLAEISWFRACRFALLLLVGVAPFLNNGTVPCPVGSTALPHLD